jgi:hypothetical protein
MAICLSPQKIFSYFSIKNTISLRFYKGQLAIDICFSQQITSTVFYLPGLSYKEWHLELYICSLFHCCFYIGQLLLSCTICFS